ncbi:riboflavin kinase/FMN adenylyltransferase [Peptoniphilus koenoeneniae]|uniref:Riboflavin biosynthesis protein n=1 Tax=Peptoniphilus koenoeneniae TaxID=507751 RepID=A0ABU0ATG9_9FIRM|nr:MULTISPECIES: bifunctional riboflavin kinase/FAD synthetase [Peptoniphilus]ERT56712.1 riboflavin biosynthesis protein RibF [Peptoniphilus sp. BV3C26]MDQ0274071.1 riboflavin kinase/FMN adenylyltransferase [Peptoniphilus koenoeneniae]
MKILKIDMNFKAEENSIIALGNFDGVHTGHQKLIKQAIKRAKEKNIKASILIFKENTEKTINGENSNKKLLTSNPYKYEILQSLGIDLIYEIEFDEAFMKLDPLVFLNDFLYKNLKVMGIVVGYDYRFGYKAKGDLESLKSFAHEKNISLDIIEAYKKNGKIVSSTLIRSLVENGSVEEAGDLLGRPFAIIGKVSHGKNLGKKMGFPTANIIPKKQYILPKYGVYDTDVIIDNKRYKAATSVGNNPTFKNEGVKIEANILDFNQDIYGKVIRVDFIKRLRDMLIFDNVEELFEQIKKDVDIIRNRKTIDK